MNNEDTLSGEVRTEDVKLERQPEKGEWAYTTKEAGYWMEGPNLPAGPIAKEIVLNFWTREENRKEDKDGHYVDLSGVAGYMGRVHALHTPDGCIYDITYEVTKRLKPGTPTDEEV